MSTAVTNPVPIIANPEAPAELHVSRPDDDPAQLRTRLNEDGYLLVRGLIDLDGLGVARADVLALCRREGWLKEGTADMDAIAAGPLPTPERFREVYVREVIHLPSFNAVAVQPRILGFFSAVFGAPAIAHPRTIGRIVFPVPPGVRPGYERVFANTTQPHQDFFYIRGTPETYTAWLPTADCPRELGGLAVLPGSHRLGFLPHLRSTGAGGHGIDTQSLPGVWSSTDFRAGDALIFHSHTIHGGLPNRTADRIRVSFDFRYQCADAAIDPDSLLPHAGP